MTPSEPPHTGVRPLSPFGEGYCRQCRFIEPLGPDGTLEPHWHPKNARFGADRDACPGSDRRPATRTPFFSRLAAFRTRAPRVTCPGCGRERVAVQRTNDTVWLERHIRSGRTFGVCDWSFRRPDWTSPKKF